MPLSKITAASITDNSVTTAKVADDAITGAKIENNPTIAGNLTVSGNASVTGDFIPSTSSSTQNILINGDMVTAQRASSSTSQGVKTVDRWQQNFSQVAITQSQQSTATSDAPYQNGFTQYYRMQVTSASSSTASYAQIVQQIEARNILRCGWNYKSSSSYVTLSFWARSSLAGTYQAFLYTVDMSPNKIRSNTFTLAANTWTKIELSYQGDSSLTIDNNTDAGMLLYIVPHYGTSFTGSNANTSSWYTVVSQDYMIDFPQNWGDTNGRTFDVTGCQLEVGSSATPYKHETPQQNHRRCYRYYYKTPGQFAVACINELPANKSMYGRFEYPVAMRSAPNASFTGIKMFEPQVDRSAIVINGVFYNTIHGNGGVTFSGSSQVGSTGDANRGYFADDPGEFMEFDSEYS